MYCSNEKYLDEIKKMKNVSQKITWNAVARCFCCPTCYTGTSMKQEKCIYCGQLLLPYLDWKDEN